MPSSWILMKLTEINIYPIKSTRPIVLTESDVLPRGLPWDRRWMLVDTEGRFVTARHHPALATVATSMSAHTLDISVAGFGMLQVPLAAPSTAPITVTVWKDRCEAVPAGAAADAWFSDFLGMPCRLVRMTDALVRPVNSAYGRAGDQVSFADSLPLLLISEASLEDLNRRLPIPVPMQRFRPNLVVDGERAYGEDGWRRLRIGEVELAGAKNCSRCLFTTLDPETGVKDPGGEPLRTLASYRRREGGGVFFGQKLIPRSAGIIHLGDPVEVLERGM
jgi:uncharacterized protein YcbX